MVFFSYFISGGDIMLKSFILYIFSIFFVFGILSFLIKLPKTTYIMKTLNDENSIETRLRLAMLRYNEIIVVDLGSTDDTLKIIEKMVNDYENTIIIEKYHR